MAKKGNLVSLNEAIQLIDQAHGNDPSRSGRNVISKGTLYNAIAAKRIQRHGPRHFVQVAVDDILSLFGPKRSA